MSDEFTKVFPHDVSIICNENSKDSVERGLSLFNIFQEHELTVYFRPKNAPNEESLDKHFAEIHNGKYILTIFDENFSKDDFTMYTMKSVYRTLIDAKELTRFIPVLIGVEVKDVVPQYISNFCLEFSENWKEETKQMDRLITTLQEDVPPYMD